MEFSSHSPSSADRSVYWITFNSPFIHSNWWSSFKTLWVLHGVPGIHSGVAYLRVNSTSLFHPFIALGSHIYPNFLSIFAHLSENSASASIWQFEKNHMFWNIANWLWNQGTLKYYSKFHNNKTRKWYCNIHICTLKWETECVCHLNLPFHLQPPKPVKSTMLPL